jgi:hypothetical protein
MVNEYLIGVVEPARNDLVAVGTSAIKVAEVRTGQNPRSVILIRNTSTSSSSIITLSAGMGSIAASKGIVLQQGESFSESNDAGYTCFQGQWTALCTDANGQLSIFER